MFANKLIIILLINLANFIINCLEFNNNDSNDCFRAAVYEHIPLGNVTTDEPITIIKSNLDVFDQIADKASEMGANILVFPEDAIIPPTFTRSKVSQFTEQVDDPHDGKRHNPCEEPTKYKTRLILYRLSCMAKRNAIYIIADMGDFVKCNPTTDPKCPKDGHYLFNTAVAFDIDGYLVAKYHKMQLYYETYYNIPPKPEIIYFDTPFGRLGLHICFDMVYKLPGTQLVTDYNVTTMVFPTWWFDELPFVFATQMQQSWAITNRVNLLAANIHWPQTGSLGSGIYSGEKGAIVYTDIPDDTSKLLIADIPIDSRNTKAKCLSNPFTKTIAIKPSEVISTEFSTYDHMNMIMDGFTLFKLKDQNDSFSSCNNGFCCQLNYSVQSKQTLEEESYWFVIANRTGFALNQRHYPICEEICGVVRCDSNCQTFPLKTDKTIFKSIQITANFSTKYAYPSVTTNNLQLVPMNKWNYKNNGSIGSQVSIDVNGFDQPIMTTGFYGRCFGRDPPYHQ